MATGLHIRNGVVFDGFTNSFSSSYALSYDPATGQVGYMGTGSFTSGYLTLDNTGSFVTNAMTASMLSPYTPNSQTASFVRNTQTGSFLTTGSSGNGQTASGSLTITQNLTVLGTASFQYVTTVYETASVIYSSGSNQFGDATNDTQTLIGTTKISGSLEVTASTITLNIPSKANGYVLGSDASGNATWINPNNITTATPIYIATGSVTASVNTAAGNFNMFALTSGSKTGLTYSNEGVLTLTNVSGSGLPTATINTGTGHSLVITTTGILRLGNSSANSILLNTNSTDRWYILGNGHFVATTDNTYDIGASGANRVRNIYVAGTGSFEKGLIVTGSTYLKSLSNVSTTNVLSYDTSTGKVYYLPTSSLVTAPTFPYTGNATISGSLTVSGSGITLTGSLGINGSLTEHIVTGSLGSGTTTVFQRATGSYTSALAKYTVNKSTNARAGEFMTVWNGNDIVSADISTTDIGSTAEVAFTSSLVNGQIQTNVVTGTSGWNVKMLITYL